MRFVSGIRPLIPARIVNAARIARDKSILNGLSEPDLETSRLPNLGRGAIEAAMRSESARSAWADFSQRLDKMDVVTHAGGVNRGDRQAIFHLVHHFRPGRVLEIGTHIGASTVCIAGALQMLEKTETGGQGNLTTVDIIDVNDAIEKPWLASGSKLSPAQLLDRMGVDQEAEFVQSRSIDFLSSCERSFDFIFLDGDHSARTVYEEVPLALARLQPGGMILLHDYYPDAKPLWSNGKVLPGPYLALEKLAGRGRRITVLPLGSLPWPTKLDSTMTSLAILTR